MSIKAVLFDFDGTLADSNELIAQTHLHVLNHYFPGRFDRESVKPFNGPSLETTYQRLLPGKVAEMCQMFRDYNALHHDAMIKSFPDVQTVLERLKAAGFIITLVSAKRRVTIEKGISALKLDNLFDEIVASGEYEKPKPDPEPLQKMLAKLHLSAEQTVMVGDSPEDILAAHAAKMPGIFVEWSEKPRALIAETEPDISVANMVELERWLNQNK